MKIASSLFVFLCIFSLNTYADCNDDVVQMKNSISQWASITTPDKSYRFLDVNTPSPTDNNWCIASATPEMGYTSCHKIRWKMGDWGTTFTCAE